MIQQKVKRKNAAEKRCLGDARLQPGKHCLAEGNAFQTFKTRFAKTQKTQNKTRRFRHLRRFLFNVEKVSKSRKRPIKIKHVL